MRGLRRAVGARVVLVTGKLSVRGRLVAVSGGVLLIRDAVAVERELGSVPVDGELLVPVGRVEYVQVLP